MDKVADIVRHTQLKDRIAGHDVGMMTKAKGTLQRKRAQLAAKMGELEVWTNVGRRAAGQEMVSYTEEHSKAGMQGGRARCLF